RPPSVSESPCDRPIHPIPTPAVEIPDAAIPQNADPLPTLPASANTACRSWTAAWPAPLPDPEASRSPASARSRDPRHAHPRGASALRWDAMQSSCALFRPYRPSAMTRRATRQFARCSDLVFRRQFLARFQLICGSLPIHVKNLISRPQNALRIAMAVQAPFHLQCRRLKNQRHLIDLPMARRAAHALVRVNAVIEINVVGQPMYTHALNWFIIPVAGANRFQVPRGVEQHRMTIHARFGGRHARRRGHFHAGMTVPAVDPVIPHVMFVAELHRLLSRYVLIRQIR